MRDREEEGGRGKRTKGKEENGGEKGRRRKYVSYIHV